MNQSRRAYKAQLNRNLRRHLRVKRVLAGAQAAAFAATQYVRLNLVAGMPARDGFDRLRKTMEVVKIVADTTTNIARIFGSKVNVRM